MFLFKEVDGDPDDCEGGDLGDGGGSTTHLPADDSELLDADRTLADADSSSDIDNRAVEVNACSIFNLNLFFL